jgi:thiosulfate/3-mercaptopyruvate sulfurtransferase
MILYPMIVQPETVYALLEHPEVVIIDASSPEQFAEGHLPGAQNLAYSEFVVTRGKIEGAIAEPDKIIEIFSRVGIDHEKQIFVYDSVNNARACRLIWTLHYFGHSNATLVDGGLGYWKHRGYPVSQEASTPSSSNYAFKEGSDISVYADRNFVMEHLLNGGKTLLDTRTIDEFTGKKILGKGKKGGHIPGAKNINWTEFMNTDYFNTTKTRPEVEKLLKSQNIVEGIDIVVYCHSHLRSSHTYVVLAAMGFPNVIAYAGSWSEWSAMADGDDIHSEQLPREDQGEGSDPANSLLPYLVEVEELKAKLDEEKLLLLDVSMGHIFENGHIPGAIRVCMPTMVHQHDNCDCDIPPDDDLSRAFSTIGLTPDHHVAIYDHMGGPLASRIIWTLEEIGHSNCSLVNGGFHAWESAGYDIEEGKTEIAPSNYIARKKDIADITKEDIMAHMHRPNTILIDTRLDEEFDNRLMMTDRGGRIPGTKHFFWENAVDLSNDKRFKSDDVLQKYMDELGATKDKDIIVYCQTHTRSSHTYCVLKHLGYPHVRAYAAGYSEWGNETTTPIENELFEEEE